ncbi:MAG: caspase family protein [Ferruginibacter sp.]|nr:caspase family protein [Chitinophagaceae bacterium]
MQRKFFPRLLFSCLIILLNEECAHAQLLASRNNKVYTDYKKEHKELLLDEQFNSNEGRWPAEAKIYDGILTLNEDQGETFKRNPEIFTIVPADLARDFEIEISFLYFKNSLSGAYGVSWDNFLWQFQKGDFFNVDKYENRWKYLINHAKYDINKKTNNKYTIRKIGTNYYFFINEKYVGSTEAGPLTGLKIGFYGKTLSVDYVKVSYLLREGEALVQNTPPSRNNPASEDPVPVKQEIKQAVKEAGKYYALVIGVSKYNEPLLNLDNPEKDAEKIKEIFVKRYSFEDSTTFLLLNPTRQKIIAELYRLRKIIKPADNLLIFYAGHGYWDKDAKQGYWWAKDATPEDPSTWLSNSDLREQIRSIKSTHTLLISDACFSGGIFRMRSGNEIQNATKDIQLLYKMPSRRAITSGTMTAVPDNSVFLEYFAKRLTENQSKFLSSQQLFDSLRTAVINNSSVVPQDGVIAETGDEGGDFIFILKEN